MAHYIRKFWYISRISDLCKAGKLAVAGGLCVAAGAGYFYMVGGIDYLQWLYKVPKRPDQEVAFVSRVEDALDRWRATTESHRRSDCAICHASSRAWLALLRTGPAW